LFTINDCSRIREQSNIVNMRELEIINKALENLQAGTGIRGIFEPGASRRGTGFTNFTIENQVFKLNTEIKVEWRNHHLPALLSLKEELNPLMIVAERLFPKMKEDLRELGIAYLEANGNFYLRHKGIFCLIDTAKGQVLEKKVTSRAFTKTGLRVVFQFLLDENYLNLPYRHLAEQLGIGIGNITNIIKGLRQDGFLLPLNKKDHCLHNKHELLNQWMDYYERRLKPELKMGQFRFVKNEDFRNWKNLPLKKGATCWGGEPAAELLTNYLRPAELTLYTTETRIDLIKQLKLIPDENGNVKIFKKFWHGTGGNETTVPALLIYADLINTGDKRCIETAQIIFNEHLAAKF